MQKRKWKKKKLSQDYQGTQENVKFGKLCYSEELSNYQKLDWNYVDLRKR